MTAAAVGFDAAQTTTEIETIPYARRVGQASHAATITRAREGSAEPISANASEISSGVNWLASKTMLAWMVVAIAM
jgi:hypothetical protein